MSSLPSRGRLFLVKATSYSSGRSSQQSRKYAASAKSVLTFHDSALLKGRHQPASTLAAQNGMSRAISAPYRYRRDRRYSDVSFAPPSSSSPGPNSPGPSLQDPVPPNKGDDEAVSDRVWELRTGRAIDILQSTLPDFFRTGLVSTNYHLPIHLHSLLDVRGDDTNGKAVDGEPAEGIYARHIRLEYTPPVALPAPLPRVLSVEGLPLYVASSVFMRATLGTLYNDLEVNIHRIQVRGGASGSSPTSTSISSPPSVGPTPSQPTSRYDDDQQWSRRQLSIIIGLLVSGKSRLALNESKAEWDVECTYTFSPRSGLIHLHTVNSIHPAPSETVYQAFQRALSKLSLAGIGGPTNQGKGAVSVSSPRQDGSL